CAGESEKSVGTILQRTSICPACGRVHPGYGDWLPYQHVLDQESVHAEKEIATRVARIVDISPESDKAPPGDSASGPYQDELVPISAHGSPVLSAKAFRTEYTEHELSGTLRPY